jgi:hypothetical protein
MKFNACCSVQLGNKGNYLFQPNVHFLMFFEIFKLFFAQHVSDVTTSIIRNTTVVYAARGFLVLVCLFRAIFVGVLPHHNKNFARTLESVHSFGINNYLYK